VSSIRLLFVQPVLAGYRLPFLERLAQAPGIELRVAASPRVPGSDFASVVASPSFPLALPPCSGWLGNRLFWQHGLRVPAEWGPGDVAVIPGMPRFLSNFKLFVDASGQGLGVVVASHGWTAHGNPLGALLRRRLLRFADAVVLYTDKEVDRYRWLGFPAARLFAMNNALDQEPIQRAIAGWDEARLAAFRQEQGLAPDSRQLLFCGRLTPKTGLPVLLHALRELGPGYRLVVVGGGGELVRLQQQAVRLGLEDRIRWLGPIYEEARLAPWFLTSELFVYPGAIGLSLLHAFGYGLPVVTHDNLHHQMPEIAALESGRNGLLYREGDAADLARQIRRAGADESLRRALAQDARRTVAEVYTLDAMVARFAAAVRCASEESRQRASR